MKKAVFLFDYTGEAAVPWLLAGYECWLFDGQHKPGVHRDGAMVRVGVMFSPYTIHLHAKQIREMVGDDVRIVIGFPECTELTVTGAPHWAKKRKKNPAFQIEAVNLCRLVEEVGDAFNCPWVFENPARTALTKIYGQKDFEFNPCDFGGWLPPQDVHPIYPQIYPPRDAYNKLTGLWGGNGIRWPEKRRVEPAEKDFPGWAKSGGKSVRTKNIRSCTPRGWARAMYEANK